MLTKLLSIGLISSALTLSSFAGDPPESLRNLLTKNPSAMEGIPKAAVLATFRWIDANEDRIRNRDYVTIVDYTVASRVKRMHVIDMKTGDVAHYLAAHGKNSGGDVATEFSNVSGSLKSSVGAFLTAERYHGKHGLSLRLDGMERTNSNARPRAIVLHSAKYVSEAWLERNGRLGRSWGCVVVEKRFVEDLVTKLEGGSVLYVYGG